LTSELEAAIIYIEKREELELVMKKLTTEQLGKLKAAIRTISAGR